MNTLEVIAKRKSVRSYKPEQISKEALDHIIKAGCAAPVGSGLYDSLHISVIQNESLLNDIGDAVTEMMVKISGKRLNKNFGAPTMVMVSSKKPMLPGIEFANAACVLENMAIAATSLGIDNIIWGGAAAIANEDEFRNRIGIPDGFTPVLCASFGYASEEETAKEHVITVNYV